MARNYNSRQWMLVTLYKGTDIQYLFPTNVRDSTKVAFGHKVLNEKAQPGKKIVGCNNAKPARATISVPNGTETSFIDPDKIAEVKKAGGRVTRGRIRSRGSSAISENFYITINTIKYGFQCPKLPTGVNAGELGLKSATGQSNVFYGCEFPKPPRASKQIASGNDKNNFSTFCDPSNVNSLKEAGWSVSGGNYTDLSPYIS